MIISLVIVALLSLRDIFPLFDIAAWCRILESKSIPLVINFLLYIDFFVMFFVFFFFF